ncbi:heterokaryon incompatibility protein-domain-containing protein [Echria macrotheca]|uniref:Heterokaryon incompatibility protein-domain-containing protein n=1 Tax=Echria macrotheca TaxID=438768 RepID=A0AAJ0BEA1_9PEZI|nr:heterokaryon incompatibility protein-domain-containing protein [Echria macrotheca]
MLLPSVEDGYLPYYLLFTAVMATAHSLVCYISPPASSMAGFRGPASPEPTLLQAHIYGVKNLYTTLMRGYAAYHIHDEVAYRLAMWSYVGVLLLYGSEVIVTESMAGFMSDAQSPAQPQLEAVVGDEPNSAAPFTYHPLKNNQIRVLRVSHVPADPYDPTDLLRCELTHVEISRRPGYHALSYVWGTGSVPILVNGCLFHIRPALHHALSHMPSTVSFENAGSRGPDDCSDSDLKGYYIRKRGIDEARLKWSEWLWADAICINQDDDDEKSRQIPIMSNIYATAVTVLVWIGTARGAILPAPSNLLISELTISEEEGRRRWRMGSLEWSAELCEAYLAFLDDTREWFTRVWTLQEGLLNPAVWMIHGGFKTRLNTFLKTFDLVLKMPHKNDIQGRNIEILLFCSTSIWPSNRHNPSAAQELLQLLFRAALRNCSNPHDHVYGLLGLVNTSVLPHNLRPDYSIPLGKVFHDYAAWLIRETGSVEIIQSLTYLPDADVPTWVPDLSCLIGRAKMGSNLGRTPGLRISDDNLRVTAVGEKRWAVKSYFRVDRRLGFTENFERLGQWFKVQVHGGEGMDMNTFWDSMRLQYVPDISRHAYLLSCGWEDPDPATRGRATALYFFGKTVNYTSFAMTTDGRIAVLKRSLNPRFPEDDCSNDFLCALRGSEQLFRLRQTRDGYIMLGIVDLLESGGPTPNGYCVGGGEEFVLI